MARLIEGFILGLDRSFKNNGTPQPRTWRKLSSVIRSCGWEKRSPQRLEAVNDALGHAGIYPDHDLLDMNLGLDTTVWFSRTPPLALSRVFYQERAVGYHLGKYKDVLEEVLPQYAPLVHKNGGNKREKRYWDGPERLIPDLVFKATTGETIVCEIERGDPKNESVAQLDRYMRAVSGGKHPVVGVLVTARPRTEPLRRSTSDRIAHIADAIGPIHWLWYDVSVTLTPSQ